MVLVMILPIGTIMECKMLPCQAISFLNTAFCHHISIFSIVLIYGESYRWTAFTCLIFMFMYIMLAEMDRKSETQENQKIIRICSIEISVINAALILFLLIRFLFDMILKLSQSYFSLINHIYFDYLPQYLK